MPKDKPKIVLADLEKPGITDKPFLFCGNFILFFLPWKKEVNNKPIPEIANNKFPNKKLLINLYIKKATIKETEVEIAKNQNKKTSL